KLLLRLPMLQGRPRTSTCSHNFFGVRFGVSRIVLSAYPTLEIRCKLRGLSEGTVAHCAAYSDPCLGFELVRLKPPASFDRAWIAAPAGQCVQPAFAKAKRPDQSLMSICALLPSSMDTLHAKVKD